MENPFIYQRPIRFGEPFCDRKKELEYFRKGVFSAELFCLVSIRRMGKTSLINQLEGELSGEVFSLRLDLSDIFALEDFISQLEKALSLLPFWEKLKNYLSKVLSLRPEFELGVEPLTGELKLVPRLVREEDRLAALREILRSLVRHVEKEKRHFLLIIDEFQNLRRLSPKGEIEWVMRHVFEERKSHFSALFAGSERSLLLQMLSEERAAFYRMVTLYECEPLPLKESEDFVIQGFKESFRQGPKRIWVRKTLEFLGGHPYAMNFFFHRLWREVALKRKVLRSPEAWAEIFEELVVLERKRYEDLNVFLSLKAKELLKAIALAGPVKDPYSASFLKQARLTASTVQKALKTLLRHNRVRETPFGYDVADPLEKLVIKLYRLAPEEIRQLYFRALTEA